MLPLLRVRALGVSAGLVGGSIPGEGLAGGDSDYTGSVRGGGLGGHTGGGSVAIRWT